MPISLRRGHKLPIEFRILGYAPKPWQPEDSVVIANEMVKDLNYHYFYDALAREKILAKLGPELTADLYVNRSWHDRPPTVMREDLNQPDVNAGDSEDDDDEDSPDNSVTQERVPRLRLQSEALHAKGSPVNGSNDWVVSGAHTVTGKPLLSNDMHLGHQMPNLWYEAHLHAGALDVAGVTLPGMPYVIVGHNQRIAWGFTNVGPTVTDVYIENFNAAGRVSDSEWMGAAGTSLGGNSRQGQARRERGCEDYASRAYHHGTGSGRNAAAGVALDTLRQLAHSIL